MIFTVKIVLCLKIIQLLSLRWKTLLSVFEFRLLWYFVIKIIKH